MIVGKTLVRRLTVSLMLWMCALWTLSVTGVAFYVHYEINESFEHALEESQGKDDKKERVDHPMHHSTHHRGHSMRHRVHAFYETMQWLVLPTLVFLPLLALIVRRVAAKELRPVQQLTMQIGERGGQNLSPLQIKDDFPNELIAIVESANRLLERMGAALDVERSLAANAAHELRTPIATARLRIDNAMQHDLPQAARAELVAAGAGLVQLTRRAEKLLQLSRAEGSQSLASERIDLARVTSLVVQEFWAEQGVQRRLHLVLPEADTPGATQDQHAIWVMGDMDALALALRNLIENALRHSAGADVTVHVGVQHTAGADAKAFVSVTDQGAGLTADQLAKLTQRHVRQSHNQTGFGLGLSIVKTIVDRQKARLSFASPPPGLTQGLAARIDFA